MGSDRTLTNGFLLFDDTSAEFIPDLKPVLVTLTDVPETPDSRPAVEHVPPWPEEVRITLAPPPRGVSST